MSRDLRNTLERQRKRSQGEEKEDTPQSPLESPDGLKCDTATQRDANSFMEHPGKVRNERVDDRNPPDRDRAPRGPPAEGEQEALRSVEVDSSHENVVGNDGHDGECPRREGTERVVAKNAPCREARPGGHGGEREKLRDVEGAGFDGNNVHGSGYNGGLYWMDGTTSGALCESKRLETRPLAEEDHDTGQHDKRQRTTPRNAPEPSRPFPQAP